MSAVADGVSGAARSVHMRAAVMRQGAIVVDEIDDLTVGDGQALVRTVACGICGSDLHALVHGAQMVEMQRKAGGPIQMSPSACT